ncbi:MAG: CHAT domain-containing protein [Cyclobacteriaceae bacterium]|nr:CHAT domain-containing protein [Cyclobacteriaceae bacterium]
MKFVRYAFLVLLTGVVASTGWGQAKYEKMMKAAEVSYEAGNYSKAFSALEKFKKKAFKKLGTQNIYTSTYFMRLAKYNLAAGYISEFELNLQQAINASKSINKEGSESHGLILVEAAELNNLNGTYKIARTFLDEAKSVLEPGGFMKDAVQARYQVALAHALGGQGYFNQSIEILTEQEKYYVGRAVKQETFVDEKGSLKSRRLSDEEILVRSNEYANVITLLANTYGKKGSLNSADSVFFYAAGWIKRHLGEPSLAYVKNQFYNANILVENGNENLPKDLDYARTLNNLKIKHNGAHYLGMSIYEKYLKQLQTDNNSSRYLNTKLEYEKLINKTYKPTSVYKARLRAVEFDARLDKAKVKNLETDANNLLTTNATMRSTTVSIEVNEFLYGLAIYKKEYAAAEKYLQEIIRIKNELFGTEAPETHLANLQLANFYLDNTNKIPEADRIYEDSYVKVVSKEIGPWHKDKLEILNHLATLYELTDKYSQAAIILERAAYVAASKYDKGDYQYAAELTNIARLQIKLGLYEQAEKNIITSLSVLDGYRKDDTKKGYLVQAIETQANLFGIKGMFDEAEDALDRSARIISRSRSNLGLNELNTARELSSLFIQLGRYTITEDILTELLAESEKLYGVNSIRLIDPLVDMGRLALAKGDYTEAERVAQRVNKIATEVYGEISTKTAPTQKLLAEIDYAIGDYDNAEEMINKALLSQQKQFGRNHVEVAKSLSQLAVIKFHKGDRAADVEKILTEAQTIIGNKLGTTNPQYADILKNVATLKISEKKYPDAFSVLTQAESIWRSKTGTKNNINLAAIYTLTGDVFYQVKNYAKAEEFYISARKIYEDYFNRTHPEYVKILSKQSRVYYMEKNYKRAKSNIEEALNNYDVFIKTYFPALSEREKAKYWNTMKGDFEFYNTLAFSQLEDFRDLSGKVFDYQLLTKALLLNSSIKIRERILTSTDETLKATYNLWVEKKEYLTNALSMSTQQLAANGIDLGQLTSEVERLEKEISQKSELFSQSFENRKIRYLDVQKSLAKNDVAIEMVRYRHFDQNFTDSIVYVALYVRNDNARPKAIILPEGHRMESRYFNYYRNAISTKSEDRYSYKVFWEPIQKEIGTAATIYLSADGVYNQINLEAVPTPDGKYIIDNANIVLVSNTKDLYLRKVKAKSVSTSNTATMFGNPTFYLTSTNKSYPQLPGTEIEVNELQNLLKNKGWSTTEYLEKQASEEQVKSQSSPKIFHIATHGFYSPATTTDSESLTESDATITENPLLKTGLLLTGGGDVLNKTSYNFNIESGVLTAYEAMNLNLDQTDLVVLSACETGLGQIENGEGVYGLQRAFFVAGAKVLIMSMFKVDDEATQKLIINFYRKWLNTNNLRQSFIDAKKELRIEYPEPYYWGAFMMIGLD